MDKVTHSIDHDKALFCIGYYLPDIKIEGAMDKLIIALRTAYAKDGTLDKEVTSHNDVLDAFRLALRPFKEQSAMQ
jgi:hypothetical protein